MGLEALVKLDKPFLNRDAVETALAKPARERMVMLALDEADVTASNADATGGEPIFLNGTGIGRVSSGGYGYGVNRSLALASIKAGNPGDTVEVMVLGRPHKAEILVRPPFDPEGHRLRA